MPSADHEDDNVRLPGNGCLTIVAVIVVVVIVALVVWWVHDFGHAIEG